MSGFRINEIVAVLSSVANSNHWHGSLSFTRKGLGEAEKRRFIGKI